MHTSAKIYSKAVKSFLVLRKKYRKSLEKVNFLNKSLSVAHLCSSQLRAFVISVVVFSRHLN